jgi:MFS family permease
MAKPLSCLAIIVVAVVAAGLFGMAHNQISYSVGSVYFHEFKFAQFRVAEPLHNRAGAALVGWQASWWMGALMGPILALPALLINGTRPYLRACLRGVFYVMATALFCAFLGLALAVWMPDLAHRLPLLPSSDPQGFLRAALMHEGAYLGAGLGLTLALLSIWRARRLQIRSGDFT